MSSISLLSSAEYPFQFAFIKLKCRLKVIVCITMTEWALTQIGVCGIGSMIDFLHMFAILPEICVVDFLPSCTVEGFW